jgi:5-methylcytosine-specific restriction endonuclease McrA
MNLSEKFKDRAEALYQSQVRRSRERKGPSGRITRHGYVLGFDRKQFFCWLFDQFGGENNAILCRYCRRAIDVYSCTVDHEVPLKRGGAPVLSNLGVICSPCNAVKHIMTPDEMLRFVKKLQELADEFHNSIAVDSITHRLESYSKLMASANSQRARKQKEAAKAVIGEDEDW